MRIKLVFTLLAQNGNHQTMHNILILGNQQHLICPLFKLYLWLLKKKKKRALFVFGLKIAYLHVVFLKVSVFCSGAPLPGGIARVLAFVF